MKRFDRQRGSMVVTAIVLTAALGAAGVILAKMYTSGKKADSEHAASDKALNLAEAGTQAILAQLKANNCDPTKLSGMTKVGNDVVVTQSVASAGQFVTIFRPTPGTANSWTVIVKESRGRRAARFPGVTCSTGGVCSSYALVANAGLTIDDRAKMNGKGVIPCKTSTDHHNDNDWKRGRGHSGGGGGHGNSGGGHHGGLLDYPWKQLFCSLDIVQPAFADGGSGGHGGGGSGGHGGRDDGRSGNRGEDNWTGWGSCGGWGHWHRDCMGDCNVLTSAGELEKQTVALVDLPAFIASTGAQGDVTVSSNAALGTGQYGNITVSNNTTVTFNVSDGTYYINRLDLGNNATLKMAPGTYYISQLNTSSGGGGHGGSGGGGHGGSGGHGSLLDFPWKKWFGWLEMKPAFADGGSGGHGGSGGGGGGNSSNNVSLVVSPSGVVKLYVQSAEFGNNLQLNTGGSAANFGMYVYSSLTAGNNASIAGVVYAPSGSTRIQVGNNGELNGSVLSGGQVTFGSGFTLTYDDAVVTAVNSLTPANLCAGGDSSSGGKVSPGQWKEGRQDQN
ncbi:MAG: hypothetical protein HQL64_01975 [Magnetococcales bacterium]|nr:hypothetical protein [Magnetococcales bacterium]